MTQVATFQRVIDTASPPERLVVTVQRAEPDDTEALVRLYTQVPTGAWMDGSEPTHFTADGSVALANALLEAATLASEGD